MLTALLSTALAVFIALVWIGACLLPLCLVWGLWKVFTTSSTTAFDRQQDALNAFVDESDDFLAKFQAEQVARERRLRHV
jgi:hypothetical protein